MKRIADIILLIGIFAGVLGAIYIAISFKSYMISGCFVLAAIFMIMLLRSGKRKNKGEDPNNGIK